MKLLYIAPRYHTNQIPIIEGWLENGDQVVFVSQMTNDREDHTALQPIVLGYSALFTCFFKARNRLLKCTLPDEMFAFSSKKGVPPYNKLERIVKDFMPDIAILRERSVYTMVSYHICKKLHIPCVLYNQSPYWEVGNTKKDKIKKLLRFFFPDIRMTPILGFPGEGKTHDDKAYYVPFVMEPHCDSASKVHFLQNKVQMICVAGYHDRKRLPMLVEAVGRLKEKYAIHLCVVGEVNTDDQRAYYDDITKYVAERRLQDTITLYQNFGRQQVFEQYKQSDLFVLPSTRERASISQLEAMSCSLPVICSDTNGAACQVKEGINGYLFRDECQDDLTEKIEMAVRDREQLFRMGQDAYNLVCKDYSFEIYQQCISKILADMKETHQ